ncbi:unnamed protein product [Mytilus coruscus]|uniref:Reverse transcriptase domain-containing protein n=1 Tax=Mytilus coruscus TaxID=42192 RepID=A0A6J8A8Q8_MYTCO|nr:unnamed protein product [Mytilus coruscus]
MNPTELDEAFQTLNHTITKATLAVAPKKKKKIKKKKLQIMTENISQAISEKKIVFFKRKQNGLPPDPNNPFTIQKKITTSSLRKQCRVEAALHRIQERQKIIDAGYNDPALFYSLIKKQREEFERESKDRKLPVYIALLDCKSAFDVVVHANLIRCIFQIDFTEQSILLLNNLYENASSFIKWNNLMSKQMFTIDQGVCQGGAFSADLYKIYINPLLNILSTSGFGGRVGNINCCAPTCADDVALVSNNPLELQTMVNIALDFSKREGYLLQPTKSVVIPVKTCRKFHEIEDGFWKLNGKNMPIVPNASHIGIQKSDKDSADTTVNENIKKARRAMYSLMGTDLCPWREWIR